MRAFVAYLLALGLVEDGTLIFVKRWLRFPAHRCDPCGHRFFSVL